MIIHELVPEPTERLPVENPEPTDFRLPFQVGQSIPWNGIWFVIWELGEDDHGLRMVLRPVGLTKKGAKKHAL